MVREMTKYLMKYTYTKLELENHCSLDPPIQNQFYFLLIRTYLTKILNKLHN
jgi:hypothetical protein